MRVRVLRWKISRRPAQQLVVVSGLHQSLTVFAVPPVIGWTLPSGSRANLVSKELSLGGALLCSAGDSSQRPRLNFFIGRCQFGLQRGGFSR